ncbi:MAG: hypothetical protein LBN11_03695 [Tannerella sp.]|jgi:hypothetical protein|nr:hypothetical protein [Tannerella sp.]
MNTEKENKKVEAIQPKKGWVKNVMFKAAGLTAGGGVLLTSFVEPQSYPDIEPEPQPSLPEPEHFDPNDITVATTVTDDMTLNKAFATARTECGPHGVFEWRGGVYGTYYKNEWAGFSDDYKHQFSNYPYDVERHDDRKEHVAIHNDVDKTLQLGEQEELQTEVKNVTVAPVHEGNSSIDEFESKPVSSLFVNNDDFDDALEDPEAVDADLAEVIDADLAEAVDVDLAEVVDTDLAEAVDAELAEVIDAELADDDDEVVVLNGETDGEFIDGQEVVFVDGVIMDEEGNSLTEDVEGVFDVAIVEDGVIDVGNEDETINETIDEIEEYAAPLVETIEDSGKSDDTPDVNQNDLDIHPANTINSDDFKNDANVDMFA